MDRQTNDEYQRSKDDVHEGLPPWFKEIHSKHFYERTEFSLSDAQRSRLKLWNLGKWLWGERRSVQQLMDSAAQAACEAAKCGISEHEIARELGVSRTTVRKWLDK